MNKFSSKNLIKNINKAKYDINFSIGDESD